MRLLYDKAITDVYDDLTLSGYYNYDKEVETIKSIVGKRRKILELGSGTGNLLIPLARAGFEVFGIDNSPHMIRALNKKQQEEKIKFPNIFADQRTLDLKEKFEVIVSAGGFVWFITLNDKLFICTYSKTYDDIEKTFFNSHKHLERNGLLLLNIQRHGQKFRLKLRSGMDYHFEIVFKSPSKIVKKHFIEDDGKLVFKRAFPQRIFSEDKAIQTAKDTGFKVLGVDKSNTFYVFQRI